MIRVHPWLNQPLQRCAEEGSEAEQIGKDACGGDFWTSAGTSDDHWLRVVTRGLKTHYVVAAGEARERMIERVSAQARRHVSIAIDCTHVSQHLTFRAGRVEQP